jgi:flagellar biosynthesis anti-sigma factor FlgM
MEIKNRKDIAVNSGLVDSLKGQKNPYQTQSTNTAKQNLVGQDTVSVSNQSRTLNLASKILDQVAVSRREKIESIKAKVNDGTYDVSSEKVASSIISYFDDAKVGNL